MYVVLTYLTGLMGLASGVIQFRISEALCVLPIFFPAAIPGLFIGCLISNLITGCLPWDVVFGSLATLIGAYGAFLLRRLPEKYMWVATIPTILANMIIVPPVLMLAYGVPDSFIYLALTVGLGEVVCAGFGGSGLYYLLKRNNLQWLK
jgi:uncharacterized membrane protein